MSRRKTLAAAFLAAGLLFALCPAAGGDALEAEEGTAIETEDGTAVESEEGTAVEAGDGTAALPEVHVILRDESIESHGDGGADEFDHAMDHPDSRYYKINDFYNMEGGEGLHILTQFSTYQQTTEYTCACASALMVLNYYGNHDYTEMGLTRPLETDQTEGTSADEMGAFFDGIGWETDCHAEAAPRFSSRKEADDFFIAAIDAGTPVMVNWEDWGGHWEVVIGIDTCGTESTEDDVLIMADPYDTTDHFQDGYEITSLARFYRMWREDSAGSKPAPFEHPYVIAQPAK